LSSEHTFLQLNVKLDPLTGKLSVTGNIDFHVNCDASTLEFWLHRDLKITELCGANIDSYVCENGEVTMPWMTEAVALKIKLKHPVSQDDQVSFSINYSGCLGIITEWETNRLTPEWVELGLYAPWFPLPTGNALFTYELVISVSPASYDLVSSGTVTKGTADGRACWFVRSVQPVSDIVLLAAPQIFSSSAGSAGRTEVFYTDRNHEPVAGIIRDTADKLADYFIGQYQCQESEMDSGLRIMLAPRSEGGGYVRPGMMVLSEISEADYCQKEQYYFHWFAHEIAHLWWYRAPTDCWEDWLNESFAEYAALMAMRDFYGADVFESILAQKRGKAANTPGILGLDRNNEAAYQVLYHKGPLVLYELETRMEHHREGSFASFLQAALKDQIVSTAQLLDLLTDMAGREDAQWLESKLGAKTLGDEF